MTEHDLKKAIGLLVVISHFFVVVLIVGLYVIGAFLFDEMTTSVALILPMFSVYTTAIVKYFAAARFSAATNEPKLSNEYVFIATFIPSLFVLSLIASILLKSFNIGFSNFEQFKYVLGMTEIVFGSYIGIVLSSMFTVKSIGSQKNIKRQ